MSSSCKFKIEFVISGLCHVKSILGNILSGYLSMISNIVFYFSRTKHSIVISVVPEAIILKTIYRGKTKLLIKYKAKGHSKEPENVASMSSCPLYRLK
jgi:hypothetical protein